MSKQLVFDTTVTDDDRDNVGAYVRSDDGTLITHHTEGANQRLDVDAAIRGTNGDAVTVTAGALDVNIQSADINFNESDVYAEDDPHTTGEEGSFVLAVRQDTLASSTSTDGDYAAFKQNSKGELYVIDTDGNALLTTIDADTGAIATSTSSIDTKLTSTNALLTTIDADTSTIATNSTTIAGDTTSIDANLTALTKVEDAVHSSGDSGIMSLGVRNDAGTALAADGDYIPFSMTAAGAVRVDIGSSDASLANTTLAHGATSIASTAGGTDIVTSALAARKYLLLANEGNKKAFIGTFSSVTAANGFPLSPGEKMTLRAGAAIDPAAITASGTADMRYLELS